MKKFFAIIVLNLFLIFPSKAINVNEFEIGGIGIGDSLLDHFTEREILSARNYDDYPSDMKFRIIDIDMRLKNRKYDSIQFYYIPTDKKYIVQSLNGRMAFESFKSCLKEKKKNRNKLFLIFKNSKIEDTGILKHRDDPSGNSIYKGTYFNLGKNKGYANTTCYKMLYGDTYDIFLTVSIQTKEIYNWIKSNYGASNNKRTPL